MASGHRRGSERETTRLRRLAGEITAELGIQLPDNKLTMLRGRLQRRLNQLGIDSLSAYEDRLRGPAHGQTERIQLLDLATTNKTDFFREAEHFTYLTRCVLPALTDRTTCRVWSAGCSTGEEPYSLAMVLDDHALTHPGFGFSLTGTDISVRALRAAARATYATELAEPIPPLLRQRYLMPGTGLRSGETRIIPELRARVKLQRLNFMTDHYPFGELDIVFFRNVMIYFDRPTQKQVVEKLVRTLRPGGYLFIGHTETVSGFDLPLELQSSSVLRRIG